MWSVVSIDDLDEARELIRVSLNHPDITLHLAPDGVAGLALIRELTPDLVLLDLMLPGMDGREVYQTIRADEKLSHIPILILSVLSPNPKRFPEFGPDERLFFVPKPFNVLDLRNQIKTILDDDTLWA